MINFLTKFQNKSVQTEFTETLQIDSNSDISHLESLLNQIFNRNSKYLFYYENIRIETLKVIIEKYNLDSENLIKIEYEDLNRKIEKSEIIDVGDTICLIYVHSSKIFFSTYSGKVLVCDDMIKSAFIDFLENDLIKNDLERNICKNNLESNIVKIIQKNNFKIFSYKNKIFKEGEIIEFCDNINEIIGIDISSDDHFDKNFISFIIATGKLIIFLDDSFKSIYEMDLKDSAKKLKIRKNHLFFVEDQNLFKFNLISKKFSKNFIPDLTDFSVSDRIYCSTSKSKILEVLNGKISEIPINFRFIDFIRVYSDYGVKVLDDTEIQHDSRLLNDTNQSNNIELSKEIALVLISHKTIIGITISNYKAKEIFCFDLNNQINAIEIFEDNLFLGSGEFFIRYSLSELFKTK